MISAGPNPLPIEANHGSYKEKCKAAAAQVHDKCSAGIAQRAEGDNNLYDFHEAYRNGKKVPFEAGEIAQKDFTEYATMDGGAEGYGFSDVISNVPILGVIELLLKRYYVIKKDGKQMHNVLILMDKMPRQMNLELDLMRPF